MHHHRAEHWVVVSDTAKVGRDDEQVMLTGNESVSLSIYLPVRCVHWLENSAKIPLELIEIQVGSYLGEGDIVRFEDKYGRVK
jgi:mannose-1-phosphate guanylyltransferase